MTIVSAGAAVLSTDSATELVRPAWIEADAGRITRCGRGAPPREPDISLPDAVLVPGFVDMHTHGGGGATFVGGDPDEVRAAAAFHRSHGTTTMLASLVTAAPQPLLDAVVRLAALTREGVVDGIHLEGPWLSSARCGAHDSHQLRAPDPAEIDALLAAGAGAIRMVTIAPELPGGLDAVRQLAAAGVVVAIGHTDATYAVASDAIAAGATVGTHVFNAMRPLHHREPGPALALLDDPGSVLELVADGVHVHPALVRRVISMAGPDRVALITDAMAAAGMADGSYRLGELYVDVTGGVARVRGSSTVAGSTATMDRIFANALRAAGSGDEAWVAAALMTSSTPARAIGRTDVGALRPGLRADIVALDEEANVIRVLPAAEWASEERAQ